MLHNSMVVASCMNNYRSRLIKHYDLCLGKRCHQSSPLFRKSFLLCFSLDDALIMMDSEGHVTRNILIPEFLVLACNSVPLSIFTGE